MKRFTFEEVSYEVIPEQEKNSCDGCCFVGDPGCPGVSRDEHYPCSKVGEIFREATT